VTAVLDAVTVRIAELVALDELDDVPRLLAWAEYLADSRCDYSDDHITDRLPPRTFARAITGRYETPAWIIADVERWESASPRERQNLPDPDPHRLMTTGTFAERMARADWHQDRIRTEASTVANILATRRRSPVPLAKGSEELAGLLSLAHQRIDHHHAVLAALREGPSLANRRTAS